MTNDKEGSSTSTVQENIALKCVQLTDSNYTTWAVLMETILKAYGLWETINPKKGSSAIDEKKTHTTKAMIFQTIPQDILVQVAQYETAKEVWDSVKVRYLGADLVQKARLQTLRSELETLKMKENERVQDFSGKLGSIKAKFASLGTTLKDKIIVRKLLNSVPKKFLPIVATIEQYSEIDTMPFEEAVGRITAYEERIKSADEPEELMKEEVVIKAMVKECVRGTGRSEGTRRKKRKKKHISCGMMKNQHYCEDKSRKLKTHLEQINVLDAKGIKACKVSGLGRRPTNPIEAPNLTRIAIKRHQTNVGDQLFLLLETVNVTETRRKEKGDPVAILNATNKRRRRDRTRGGITGHGGSQDVLGELPPVIGIAKLLGLAQENQEAVKECYKEYIGMAKRYYEGAKRTKQEKPEVVVGKGSGTAGIKRPQAVADVIAEIGDSLDGTQGRIAQDDAKVEGSNSVWTTDNNGEEYTSRFIEDIKASRTKKLRKEDFGITTLGRNCWTD
ncbi:hypothetical protein Tco_1524786 [Tanacetum coccineum]